MDDLRRVDYVTGHFKQLQGLRLLPLGAAVLLASAAGRGAARFGLSPKAAWLVLLAAAVAASFPIARYYEQRFGLVASAPWRSGAVTLLACAAALVGVIWIQEVRPLPVSTPLLFVSILLARLGLAAGRLRVHYLWIAGACAALGLLPLIGVPPAVRGWAIDLLIGGGLIVAAVGDHRVLSRVMTMTMETGRTSSW